MRIISAREQAAAIAFETLARHQAANGQIPKFVDVARNEPDFWYLGCIDATLWWLIGISFIDSRGGKMRLRRRFAREIRRALDWLLAQEHQRFRLLQQNEASDWADIMPRSGFVLYSNALWHQVKSRYRLAHAEETRTHLDAIYLDKLGEQDYQRIREIREWLRDHSRHGMLLAFLQAEDPYKI